MMTASVKFLGSSLLADMTCRVSEFRNHLQGIGIYTIPNMITLDNGRTLQIHLTPDDEIGEIIYGLVDAKKDTLGNVQLLCRYVYCMNADNKANFLEMIEDGRIQSVTEAISIAGQLHKQHTMSVCR